jgi:hypothetical protein
MTRCISIDYACASAMPSVETTNLEKNYIIQYELMISWPRYSMANDGEHSLESSHLIIGFLLITTTPLHSLFHLVASTM